MNRDLLSAWGQTLRRHGKKRAIIEASTGRIVTFRELDARAAAWLAAQNITPDELRGITVVYATPNSLAWWEQFLGLLKAGAIVAPLDAAEPIAAQHRITASLRAGFWWDGEKLVAQPRAKRTRDSTLCFIKLTSGTTGTPRALHFTGAQLLADARQVTATMGIRARDLNYALIPFGHSYGLGNLTIPLLAQGVPLVCGTSPLPHAIAEDFSRWQPSVFPGVPAMWRALAASEVSLKSLRLGVSAGAPLPAEVARDFAARFGRRLHNFYGSSETGGIAYDRTGQATRTGGVGTVLRDVKLKALTGNRLQVSSAAVFTRGNRHRQGKRGAWIMADRVALDKTGNVTLLGRRGQIVKIAGRRVNLGEVSARLRRINGVGEVWVGMSGENDPVLGAAVATSLKAAELRTALHADTPAWKIPKKWIVLPALPLTSRGKTDTQALQVMLFGQERHPG